MAKCKNCGKRNPFHTCYIGGGPSHIDMTPKEREYVHRTVELNRARGEDPYKGLNKSQRTIYMNQDESRRKR